MKIRLTNADFSANYIERVSEYDILALAFFDKLSVQPSVAQKLAINNMLVALKTNNIIEKMKYLFLPVAASQLSETFLNLANPIIPTSINPNALYWGLKSGKGIYNANPTNTAAAALALSLDATLSSTNLHLFNANTEVLVANLDQLAVTNTTSNTYLLLNTLYDVDNNRVNMSTNTTLATQNIYNALNLGAIRLYDKGIGLKGINSESTNYFSSYEKKTKITNNYATPINSVNFVVNSNYDLAGSSKLFMRKTHGVISIGSALSQSDVDVYSDAVDAVLTAYNLI